MDQNNINKTIEILSKLVEEDIAILIETSISNFSNKYAEANDAHYLLENIYDTKLNEIINALTNNSELIKKENALEIAFLTPDQLNPEKYQKLVEKKIISEYNKSKIKTSKAFKCSKCKKSKCDVVQKQVRAGDEPPTIFVTCLECGYSFSFST